MAAEGEVIKMEEEPLSPGARLFHTPRLNCCIIAIFGFKTMINVKAFKIGLEESLTKHPRFSSVLVVDDKKHEKMRWSRTRVDVENHVITPDLDPDMESPDQFVEDYISDLTKTSMEISNKPLWEFHILNVKTSEANALAILRIHHSFGDGASLISILLACSRKTLDPEALPSIPTKKRGNSSSHSGGLWWFLFTVWTTLVMIFNTFMDLMVFVATTLFLKDKETPIKGAAGVELRPKRIVHRLLSLNDIKLVKNAMNMTVNDVILGVTQAGLSRYLNRRYANEDENDMGASKKENNLPRRIRLRSTLLVNIRPSSGIEALAEMMKEDSKVKWGNLIGYVILPFTIALQEDPLSYVLEAKAVMDRKKLSFEAITTFLVSKFILKVFGVKAAAAVTHKLVSNTTLTFSNVVGPHEEISLYGHPLSYIAPTVYGHSYALAIHLLSYADKMAIAVAVDEDSIPDPHQLCNDIEDSLYLIMDTVITRGLVKYAV